MTATYLLIALAALGMLLSAITRMTIRGVTVGELNRMPFIPHLLMGLNLPSMIALVAWAFLTFPWYVALAGVAFFVIVFAYALGFALAPLLRHPDTAGTVMRLRSVLDVAFIAGTVALWWAYFPLGR